VGFSDRLRAWLRGDGPTSSGGDATSGGRHARSTSRAAGGGRGRGSASFDGTELLAFARARRGVEAYLEPRTNLYGHSVLLVADDGEYLRRPVPDPGSVRRLCAEHGIPVYDAARTGYPRRVRDYDRGVRPDAVSLDDLPPWPTDGDAEVDGPTGEHGVGDDDEPPPPPVPPSAPMA